MISKIDSIEQNNLEKQILLSIKNRSETINCLFHKLENVKTVLSILLSEHPEVFYVFDFELKVIKNRVEIKPKYTYSKKEIQTLSSLCQEKAKRIIRDAEKFISEYEKVCYIHDALSKTIKYSNSKGKESHTIIGALIYGQAVCDGYAKAFKYLLDNTSIESLIVTGTACNIRSIKHESHSWNMVKICGKWCHIDLTFNTSIRINDCLRYDYFGINNAQIKPDHAFDESIYPHSIGNDLEYYRRNHLFINSIQDIKKVLITLLSGRNTNIVFRLSSLVKTKDIEKKLQTIILEAAKQKKYYGNYQYSFNKYQNVIQIYFT